MIKKLRSKFIIINMLLISIVLIIVFTILCFSNYHRLKNESYRGMNMILTDMPKDDFIRKPEIGKKPNKDNFNITPIFKVEADTEGNIIHIWKNNVTISDELLQTLTSKVLSSNKSTGIIYESSLRYTKNNSIDGTKIAFADMSNEISSMKSIVLNSIITFIGSIAAFFIISLFLSKWALKPVEHAWKKQKQFVADASHELKTPLTVILANSNILLSHKGDTILNQSKWIENTQKEAERMKELVDDLLFLAKSDSNKTPPLLQEINLSDIVLSCILPFESIAFENKIEINENIVSDIKISGDENQIKQLMVILLDNACKYTQKGGKIQISLNKELTSIHLYVKNSGTPIPSEDLEHIFERFYRSDKSRSRSEGGYGLGLAIAKSIVNNHHGKISVSSDLKLGTAFHVIFHI